MKSARQMIAENMVVIDIMGYLFDIVPFQNGNAGPMRYQCFPNDEKPGCFDRVVSCIQGYGMD